MVTDDELREWDINISKLIRLSDYQKTKNLLNSINNQLDNLNIDESFVPCNARQGAIQYHNKVKKPALKKQRERLSKKLTEIEAMIKKDMENI